MVCAHHDFRCLYSWASSATQLAIDEHKCHRIDLLGGPVKANADMF